MFNKVIIAEDHESASISVRKTLEDFGIQNPHYVYYCDHAISWIRKAVKDCEPFDLLITDLSFEEDANKQTIVSGFELIKAARSEQPGLKVLVFSAESKSTVIESLFEELAIDGYVRKARHDTKELKLAIEALSDNRKYLSTQLRSAVREKNAHDFTDFDITIISLLSRGMLQKQMPTYLQEHKIKPSGLSSVEKRLNLIKDVLRFSNNEQLVAYCKDKDLI